MDPRSGHRRRLRRVAFVSLMLMFLIPPTFAFGYTLRRYGTGSSANIFVYAVTDAELQRAYNKGYFPSGDYYWRVSYNFSSTKGANQWAYNHSWTSPVTMGSSSNFTVYAQCWVEQAVTAGGAWNCDTTVP
jgi:hypothetical protein